MRVTPDLIAGAVQGLGKVHAADPLVAHAMNVPIFEVGQLVRVGNLVMRPATEVDEDHPAHQHPLFHVATPVHAYGYDELGNVVYVGMDGYIRMQYPDATDC